MPEPSQEHHWLQRMAGEWTYEMEAEGQAGEPPIHDAGRESVRSLGGVWVQCEGRSDSQGDDAVSLMTLGYNPERQRFVGTFVSSMLVNLWIYEGTLVAAADRLTLDTEGPSYTEEGKTEKYQDIIEFRGDDHRVQSSAYQREDGTWHAFVTTHYRRVK